MRKGQFFSLPMYQWPEEDRERWLWGCAPPGPLEVTGVAGTWRCATKATVRAAYAIGLDWLQKEGLLDASVPADQRWTRPVLELYIKAMRHSLRRETIRHRLLNLERALAVIAPDGDRTLLRAAVKRFTQSSDRSRKRERLQHPARLKELGIDLMKAADQGRNSNIRKNAALFRTGLQIALLAMRPLRMRNFSSLEVGVHLVREQGSWVILIPGSQSKNHRAIEFSVPKTLEAALERYLDLYRPLLAGGRYGGPRLWLGYRFGPQSAHTLQLAIVRETERAFGVPVNPHLFRDCAATSIAIDDPRSVRMAANILGHANFESTEKFYNLASSIEAVRAYNAFLRRRRRREAI